MLALHERQLGFLLLEFSWALIAAHSLIGHVRTPSAGDGDQLAKLLALPPGRGPGPP